MIEHTEGFSMDQAIQRAIAHAVRAIPPAWPLSATVAVNPFLGQTDQSLSQTDMLLRALSGTAITMPTEYYAAKLAAGEITDTDLTAALQALSGSDGAEGKRQLVALKSTASNYIEPAIERIPTIADLAATASGIDWPGIVAERFGVWAAAYFDDGQALWAAARAKRAYTEWRAVATHDLTPEVLGLDGFGAFVAAIPDEPQRYVEQVVERLGLPAAALPSYFQQMLLSLSGWSQAARYKLWQAELAGDGDTTLADLLAIRLSFEDALYRQYQAEIKGAWEAARNRHQGLGIARPENPDAQASTGEIWQLAAEYANQRTLADIFAQNEPSKDNPLDRPKLQAAFCIDVRSEVFRRALEAQHPAIETIGFAGFFGIGATHKGFASDVSEHRLPVLLNAGVESRDGSADHQDEDRATRFTARAKRAWGRFKLAAISSFAFVEAMGPIYANRLLKDSLHLKQDSKNTSKRPELTTQLSLETRVDMAVSVLTGMGWAGREHDSIFAPFVLLVGHGANTSNNPFNSALHCGACGGHAGDVNVRLLAGLLNDQNVKTALADKGISVPADTHFVPALHDTTTDKITLFDLDDFSPQTRQSLAEVEQWFEQAGNLTRAERALRLPGADGAEHINTRSRNWAEIRPEWGLAGCSAFIAAPRKRTSGKALEGRAFLHDYHWQRDPDFTVLELILTAPVVVASWISLQYYGSSVAPNLFGAGNKLLHNVSGGMGVVEGNGGALRTGLPWQSVHDGIKLAHDPLRLAVCVEAPTDAITAILAKHDGVRALFDNNWLHLLTIDENGQLAQRYAGDLSWVNAFGDEGKKHLAVAA